MATMVSSQTAALPPASSQSYFEIVNANLLRLGSLTLEDFLRDPYQEPAAQENFLSNPLYHDAPVAPPPIVVEDKDGENKSGAPIPAPIFVLHQICSQTFGSIDALNYEIIEEEGKEKKRCILTITRPNGATRSYTSKPEFAHKAAARAGAASVGVEMGAIDFIKYGSPDAVVKRGLVLAPLDAPGSVQAPLPTAAEEDTSVQEIEKCCVEWRAGRVKPRWIFLIDSKPTGKYGCALQIKLSLHLFRAFSVDVEYATFEEAKAACAADAIAEGVMDFIKFGNGQTAPAEKRLFATPEDRDEAQQPAAPPPIALTLQGFFEALPRPLPEPVDNKTVGEINAPGWLNMLIQSARGGKLVLKFIWTTDTKLGTHGAVLRITRPGEVRTYMVDPQFAKRVDAKSAVCLTALAAGVGAYVRGIGEAVEAKISPETRSRIFDCIFPLMLTEYSKFWPNRPPEMFEYTKDRDAFGCILRLKLTGRPEERETRSWTVPAEYRNKNDAKVAVVQLAFEQGALEFLRFSGEPPPEGYKVEMPAPRETKKAKRKATATEAAAENEDGNPKKKAKLLSQALQFEAAALPSKPITAALPPKPSTATVLASENGSMFLPRPGYFDSKPEPGELPDEPLLTPVPRHQAARTREPPPPPRPAMEPRSEPRGGGPYDYDYGAREHGHQYERYDDLNVYPAADPYYAPSPAPNAHAESWHAHPRAYPSEDDDEYRRAAYYPNDYAAGYEYDDYTRRRDTRYTPPPPPPPEPAHHAYDNPVRREGYEDAEYAAAYARPPAEYTYAHMPPALRRTQQHTSPPILSPLPPSPPPRVWQTGPHAPPSPPAPPAPSSLGNCSSSVQHLHSKTPTPVPVPEPTTSTYSCKDELIEYCKANAHPCPRFEEGAADTDAPRYKVWIVLGQERLELPTTYVKVEDGEEKLARKVLQRLRAQDAGKAKRGPE